MQNRIMKLAGIAMMGVAMGAATSTLAEETDTVRRVVTGLDASEKAVVLFDTEYTRPVAVQDPIPRDFWTLSGFPAEASGVDNGLAKITAAFSPDPQKLVFRTVDFPPAPPKDVLDTLPKDMLMKIAGNEAPKKGMPPNHPFTHRTKTIDFAVVVSGEIDMVLDDSTVHLKAGDLVVQQETNHAWVNNGTDICRIAFVQVSTASE